MSPGTVRRLLIVDDSAVVRQVVTKAFANEASVDVVGGARDGRDALDKIESLRPDVVILDLEMPVMDGFQTLAELRRNDAKLPVIVFSHLTQQSASATLDALELGATDFALKPTANGIQLAEEYVRDALLPLITGLTQPAVDVSHSQIEGPESPVVQRPRIEVRAVIGAVVIGVSTGGPNALPTVIGQLPADLRVPVFVVQHMPAMFTRMLAERLDRGSEISVVEASAGEEVVNGRVYIAPGERHMALEQTTSTVTIVIHDGPAENSHRPAVDVLFRSAADVYGARVAAVVMTGMGEDGLHGCEAVSAAGGRVMTQSEATCVSTRMPLSVTEAGLADAIVPLDDIGDTITKWVSGIR